MGESTMSQEETKQNFDIERKKHIDFFLPFYQEKNWIVNQDNINSNSPMSWDVRLEIFAGEFKLVDEKVVQSEWNNCLVEIIQDIKTKNWGWLLGEKDWILYSTWADIEADSPSGLYLIKSKELKDHVLSLRGIIKMAISQKGWGHSWNVIFEWDDLIRLKIADKII